MITVHTYFDIETHIRMTLVFFRNPNDIMHIIWAKPCTCFCFSVQKHEPDTLNVNHAFKHPWILLSTYWKRDDNVNASSKYFEYKIQNCFVSQSFIIYSFVLYTWRFDAPLVSCNGILQTNPTRGEKCNVSNYEPIFISTFQLNSEHWILYTEHTNKYL